MSLQTNLPEPLQQFRPKEMMAQAELFALSKVSKSFRLTFGLAIMAGLFIGLAFIFYTTSTTGSSVLGWGLSHLVGGLAFSLGLIFIVVCGGELFTSTVLSLISFANKTISFNKMIKTWLTVYLGNFIGASLLVCLVMMAQLYNADHGQWGLNVLHIAQHKLQHQPLQAFSLGVLCNLLVCLAMWMTLSSNNIATKAMLVILPVALFVSTGFEHCVANMFMVPLGIMIENFAPTHFWSGLGVSAQQFSDLTWANFITHNLIPVTLGNIVGGGVMVGLGYLSIFGKTKQINTVSKLSTHNSSTPIKKTYSQLKLLNKGFIMNLSNTLIGNVMDTNPLTLQANTPINQAIIQLNQAGLDAAPVVDEQQQLVGFISSHDVLVELWCQDYNALAELKVEAVMKKEVQTVNPSDSLLHLAEYISIDHDQLHPVTAMGIATTLSTESLSERARNMKVDRPHHYPVVKDDKLVGVINRRHIMQAISNLLLNPSDEEQELASCTQKIA